MGQEFINPDFQTTTYFGMKSLTEEEILNKLQSINAKLNLDQGGEKR